MLSSESKSVLLLLCDVGEEVGLDMVDPLVDGNAGAGKSVFLLVVLLVEYKSLAQDVQAIHLCMALLAEMVLKWG